MYSPTPSSAEIMPIFYIGQHETNRSLPVSDQLLRQAQDFNYDMLSTPITTSQFHSNVLTLLSNYMAHIEGSVPEEEIPMPLIPPLTSLDTNLTPNETISQLIAFTSPWIDLASPDPVIASLSKQVFNLEIAYAAFCGIGNVIIQGLALNHGVTPGSGISQYARVIQEALGAGPYLHLQILMQMREDSISSSADTMGSLSQFARQQYLEKASHASATEREADLFSTWDTWNVIRSVCKYSSRLSIALLLPKQLPPMPLQSRWFSEPLKELIFPETSFLKNAKGYPVLSKSHQALISRYMRLRNSPWLLLSDVGQIPGVDEQTKIFSSPRDNSPGLNASRGSMSSSPTPAEAAQQDAGSRRRIKDPTPHLSYMRHLQANQPPKSAIERFGAGYQDYLQAPLQPLTDNLESITYEVFEKDPVKYDWYEMAICNALNDWMALGRSTSSSTGAVVIAVVGAGRGPLVTRALRAAEKSGVLVDVYAVEKNPNAYVLLQRHNHEDWNMAVTVIKSDMRFWKGPLQPDGSHGRVDILVSELLGSFADNELSPECLDGVQHVLNPLHGISIPSSYTAHMTPIAAPRLHADCLGRSFSDPTVFETPYVVMLHALDFLSTIQPHSDSSAKQELIPLLPDVKTAWAFSHPIPPGIILQSNLRRGGGVNGGGGGNMGGDGANEHNVRYSRLNFHCPNRGVCHGIAGYFETVLYRGPSGTVELSTNPVTMESKSKDMISWFPIFFPLKTPVYIPDNSELEISMWRQTDDRKVWYEWLVEVFMVDAHRRIRLGVSDIHSSKKNGCLM
ncbi:arginine N-methyltransferas-like protein [Patellaria atrata CBS 101060]|uniref:Protein arginine N-methyltransferase n=1 Tax=Patellaria atrata CBS 101060 TaxID=1346257 RepID=A0A9P4SIT2_9PEZI|nr:arginine N-methyltransferas-like protein [Patellaria atrata CBS 101060]